MATHQTAHADPTIVEREAELQRAETSVETEEQQLEADLARARAEAAELGDVLQRFAGKLADAKTDRGDVNELTLLGQRLDDVAIPSIDLDGHRERQLTVRADSLRARTWVVKAMRQELRRFSQDLGYVASLIDEGQEAIERLDGPAAADPKPRTKRRRMVKRSTPSEVSLAAAPAYDDAADMTSEDAAALEATAAFEPPAATAVADPQSEATVMVQAAELMAAADDGEAPSESAQNVASVASVALNEDEPTDSDDVHTIPPRDSPRVRMEARIDLHSDSNFFNGFSANISDGGVFIATDHDVAIGTEVEIAFTLPSGIEIRGRGVVRWCSGARDVGDGQVRGVGVQFTNLSGAASTAIANFIQSRDPIFYPM